MREGSLGGETLRRRHARRFNPKREGECRATNVDAVVMATSFRGRFEVDALYGNGRRVPKMSTLSDHREGDNSSGCRIFQLAPMITMEGAIETYCESSSIKTGRDSTSIKPKEKYISFIEYKNVKKSNFELIIQQKCTL